MKIQRFSLKKFDNKEPPPLIHISIPDGSKFLKIIIVPDGVEAVYEVPEMLIGTTRMDTYTIIKPNQSIPLDTVFVDIVDYLFENENSPGQQGVVIFPIYKIK